MTADRRKIIKTEFFFYICCILHLRNLQWHYTVHAPWDEKHELNVQFLSASVFVCLIWALQMEIIVSFFFSCHFPDAPAPLQRLIYLQSKSPDGSEESDVRRISTSGWTRPVVAGSWAALVFRDESSLSRQQNPPRRCILISCLNSKQSFTWLRRTSRIWQFCLWVCSSPLLSSPSCCSTWFPEFFWVQGLKEQIRLSC